MYDQIDISAGNGIWRARHRMDRISGPLPLAIGGIPIVINRGCEVDDIADDMALVQSQKSRRKGRDKYLIAHGYLPFGSEIGIKHAYRYRDGYVDITTTIRIPRQTIIRNHIAVGNVSLPGEWRRYRVLTYTGEERLSLSAWIDFKGATGQGRRHLLGSPPPLAIIFERQDGIQIEVGTGFDLWRWLAGFGGAANRSDYRLRPLDTGIDYDRRVSISDTSFTVVPRQYSFNWYIAWRSAKEPTRPPTTALAMSPCWTRNGDIDYQETSQLIASLKQPPTLSLDCQEIPRLNCVRSSMVSSTCVAPCFASNTVLNRLKRLMRQLHALTKSGTTIVIRGLKPGLCGTGAHVAGKGRRLHWDLPAIVEFASWTRRLFGDAISIVNEPPATLPIPSLSNLFSTATISDEHQ